MVALSQHTWRQGAVNQITGDIILARQFVIYTKKSPIWIDSNVCKVVVVILPWPNDNWQRHVFVGAIFTGSYILDFDGTVNQPFMSQQTCNTVMVVSWTHRRPVDRTQTVIWKFQKWVVLIFPVSGCLIYQGSWSAYEQSIDKKGRFMAKSVCTVSWKLLNFIWVRTDCQFFFTYHRIKCQWEDSH